MLHLESIFDLKPYETFVEMLHPESTLGLETRLASHSTAKLMLPLLPSLVKTLGSNVVLVMIPGSLFRLHCLHLQRAHLHLKLELNLAKDIVLKSCRSLVLRPGTESPCLS